MVGSPDVTSELLGNVLVPVAEDEDALALADADAVVVIGNDEVDAEDCTLFMAAFTGTLVSGALVVETVGDPFACESAAHFDLDASAPVGLVGADFDACVVGFE